MSGPWYVNHDGVATGPLSDAELAAAAVEGRLRPTDHVRQGNGPWTAARQVKGLAFLAAAVRIVPSAAPAVAAAVAVPMASTAPPPAVAASAAPPPPPSEPNAAAPQIVMPQVDVTGLSVSRKAKAKANPAKSGSRAPLIAAGLLLAIGGAVGGVLAFRNGDVVESEAAPNTTTAASHSTPSTPADLTAAAEQARWAQQPNSSLGMLYDANSPAPPPHISTFAPPVVAKIYSTEMPPSADIPAAALERLRATLVRVDFESGSIPYRSLGIPLGEQGEFARLGRVPDKLKSATATRYADGKASPITGYSAAILASRLTLLKTDLPTTDAASLIGRRPAAGETVIVYGFGFKSDVPYVLGKGLVEEDSSRPTPGGYEGARCFRILFDSKEILRGSDLLLNEEGQIVGFAVMRGSNATQAVCMEISHLFELASRRRPALGDLAELTYEAVKRAEGNAPTATVAVTPGFAPRPTGSLAGPSSTTISPAASGPLSATTSSGPPADATASPTGGTTIASTSGRSSPRVSRSGSRNSSSGRSSTAVATMSEAGSQADRLLLELKSIVERRGEMLAENAEIERRLKPLVDESQALDKQYRDLDDQARPITARLSWLANKISSLNFLRARAELEERLAMDAEIRIYQAEQQTLNAQYQQLVTRANGVRKQYDAAQAKIQVENNQLAILNGEARVLREEFIRLVAPLDGSARPHADAVSSYFTELIEGEKDAEIGHFARGALRLQQGDLSAAVADLDAAVNFNARDSTYRTVRAAAYFRLGREADAKKELAEALKADKQNAWVPYLTALSYCKNGAFAAIEAQLREALKLDPKFVEANTLLALVKSTAVDDKIRNGAYALKTAQTAASLPSPSCATQLAIAAAQAETGDFDQAAKTAQAALASAAGGPQAEWCRECLKSIEARQPVRIDWKSFDVWTRL